MYEVQIHDDTPRNQWKLAVIEELVRGADWYVRSVTVHTASGRINQPIACLYPLEVLANECSTSNVPEMSSQETEKQLDTHDGQDDMTIKIHSKSNDQSEGPSDGMD